LIGEHRLRPEKADFPVKTLFAQTGNEGGTGLTCADYNDPAHSRATPAIGKPAGTCRFDLLNRVQEFGKTSTHQGTLIMAISNGDTLPNATLREMTGDGPAEYTTDALFKGRKVVLFGLPGAYTPTCSSAHLPSFIRTKAGFDAKGVDEIICLSVNDVFVMQAWGGDVGADKAGIRMLSDADGSFTAAMGLDFTAEPVGLINRSKRFAMVVEDGVVSNLQIEDSPGECTISAGESLLEAM
jgi:peroxiredoxin